MKDRRTRAQKARAAARKQQRAAERDSDGRMHLVLYRDPASEKEALALRTPVFKEAWQNELAVGAANTAHALFRQGASLERAVALGRSAMESTSRLGAAFLAQAPAGALACKAGCDHCCYQVVGVTPPEAFAILEHLQNTRSPAELAELRQHVAELRGRARGLSTAERFSPEHPCVFLAHGRCTIYEARPLSCRGMNALDAAECAHRLRDPEGRAKFLADGVAGRVFMEPIRGAQAVSAGLQLGLSEIHHLDMRPLDLAHAMELLLDAGPRLAAAWLAGESPLGEAVRDTDDVALRELVGTLA